MNRQYTLTDIANIALEDIGQKSINSIDGDEVNARRLNRRIFKVIDDISNMREWVKLRREGSLVRKIENTAAGEKRFIAPNGLLNIIEAYPDSEPRREGDDIIALSESLFVKYTIVSYNPSEWDMNLRAAIIAKLKAEIVMPITGDAQMSANVIKLSERDILRAIRNDIYAEKKNPKNTTPNWWQGV